MGVVFIMMSIPSIKSGDRSLMRVYSISLPFFLISSTSSNILSVFLPAIVTTASRTIKIQDDATNQEKFKDAPVAENLVEYYGDIMMILKHTATEGEISIHITRDEHGKSDIRKYIMLEEIYNSKKEEVMNQ